MAQVSFDKQITIGADPFNPTIVFTPTSLPAAQFPLATGDKTYKYDLEMAKGGKFETVAIDDFTVTGDITQ